MIKTKKTTIEVLTKILQQTPDYSYAKQVKEIIRRVKTGCRIDRHGKFLSDKSKPQLKSNHDTRG
jgi:hypothetical protein